jgi:arabinogalactan oligomer / maltooligosaccharide transport system permease protein
MSAPLNLRAFLVAVACLFLPGCGRTATPRGGIRLWHAYRGDEEKALEATLSTWKGEPVETLAVPYDAFGAKLAAAIPLGEGPDLFIDADERLSDFRARRLIAPVGDALEVGAFTAQALAAVQLGGEAWAVPLSRKCVALYVNTDLVGETPRDLEGIAELASRLPPGVFPLAYEATKAYGHTPLLAAFGGRLLGDGDQYAFIGPEAERSLDFARDLVDRHIVPEDADGSLVTNLFRTGHAAFAISGPWLAADLGSPSAVRYRVEPLPLVRATGQPMRPLLTVESLMLSPTGAARGEVRALARLLAGADAARTRGRTARALTARADVALPPGDDLLRAFAEQVKVALPMPISPAMRAVWEPADRAIRKVLRHDATPAEALPEGKHRFDDVRRPLPSPASPAPAAVLLGALCLFAAFRFVQRSRREDWAGAFRRSLPAYRYVAHAVVAIGVLVLLPLAIGAGTSLFAGHDEGRRYVGLANFITILTARGGPLLTSGSFYLVLLVTIAWTLVNVALHVTIGVSLGLVLARPALRLRALYRVLLIVPWAVPSYVTALAWKGMFHRQFGAVTALLLGLNRVFGTHLEPIAWFSRFSTAFTANVATNVWLGFPFMMVVTMGALTAVPDDVLEAAKVDGATRWQRLRLVTLPMIRPTLAPAVTLGAIWTFNMFNVVFLVSGGDPDGTTDILVSEAYRWAFTREAQYGYAAAYAVLIFLLLSGATRLGRRAARDARVVPATAPALAGQEGA